MFFNKHMNIVTKNGEKKARKKFYQKQTYMASKKRKKIVWKKCENTFLYKHMNTVTKNWGKKREKNFFPETQISQANNDGTKSSGKSAKTRFL